MYKAFLNTLKRELNRIKAYPLILVIMIAIPLAVCFVLCETFKEGSPKDLPIAVLDLDNSDLSRKIIRTIDATPSCKTNKNVLDIEDGHQQIVSGKAYGFILIPKQFKTDILQGKRPQLVYYYNNNLLLIGGIITKDINSAIQTSLGEITAYIYSTKGMSKDVAASQVNIIKIDEHIKGNPYLNYSYFLSTAAFINTFQIIAAFLAIFAIGTEFKHGTTKELLKIGNNSIFIILFGKLLPYTIGILSVMAIVYFIYFVIYGAPFEGNVLFVCFTSILFILAYQITGIMFVALSGNYRFACSAGAFYTALGFTMAGMTYPSIAMPTAIKIYSALLPIKPYLSTVIDQSQRAFPISVDLIYVYWLLILIAIPSLTIPLLKKKMQDENEWYKI